LENVFLTLFTHNTNITKIHTQIYTFCPALQRPLMSISTSFFICTTR